MVIPAVNHNLIQNKDLRNIALKANELGMEADNLLLQFPNNLSQNDWATRQHLLVEFSGKVAKFKTYSNRCANIQATENDIEQCKKAREALANKVSTVYSRIKKLHMETGIDPFSIPPMSLQRTITDVLNSNKGWIISGLAGTVAATHLIPLPWAKLLRKTANLGTFTVGGTSIPLNPLIPFIAFRELLNPEFANTIGIAALFTASLYPTYRIATPVTRELFQFVHKGVNWADNHHFPLFLASSYGAYALGIGSRLGYSPVIAPFICGSAAVLGVWGVVKPVFDQIKTWMGSNPAPLNRPNWLNPTRTFILCAQAVANNPEDVKAIGGGILAGVAAGFGAGGVMGINRIASTIAGAVVGALGGLGWLFRDGIGPINLGLQLPVVQQQQPGVQQQQQPVVQQQQQPVVQQQQVQQQQPIPLNNLVQNNAP